MHLAMTDLFRARWSADIHNEWMKSVIANFPDITHRQVMRIRDLMDSHVRDCLVSGYETLIANLDLPDPNDRHVLAAAIKSGADMIVTFNLKHFPSEKLQQFCIEATHPDDFIKSLSEY